MNEIIKREIADFGHNYASFRGKQDNYVFNGLFVKSVFYKNPSLVLDEQTLNDIVVDGTGDNGIDCILTDLTSDHNDLVFIQCKYYESITLDGIKAAVSKMVNAFIMLKQQKFDQFKTRLYPNI